MSARSGVSAQPAERRNSRRAPWQNSPRRHAERKGGSRTTYIGLNLQKSPRNLDITRMRSMPTEPYKPCIFVSYAHADKPEKPAADEVQWMSFVSDYLRPAVKYGVLDMWIDTLMRGGADWDLEIERKLRECDIFVLLVSRYSLSSDYVLDKEIAIIRERQAHGEDVHFYPLVLTPTPKIALAGVHRQEFAPAQRQAFFRVFDQRSLAAHVGGNRRDRGDRGQNRHAKAHRPGRAAALDDRAADCSDE